MRIGLTVRCKTNNGNKMQKFVKRRLLSMKRAFHSTVKSTLSWAVHGLFLRAVGSYGKSVIDFFSEFKLDKAKLKDIGEPILMKTIDMVLISSADSAHLL